MNSSTSDQLAAADFNQRFLPLSHIAQDNMPLRKPEWLKVQQVHGERLYGIKRSLRRNSLYTVCEEAHCPNMAQCLNAGTATFMILGDTCTRGCRFCNVKTGNPGGSVNPQEPQAVAAQVKEMGLDYVVLTMVDRDDLPDGGAEHIAHTVWAIRQLAPHIVIEILTGDFRKNEQAISRVLNCGINVFAHNIECVAAVTSTVRDARASYQQSLEVLQLAKKLRPDITTKSGLMLGVGETPSQVAEALAHLRAVDVDILTIGQYLRPTSRHLPVSRYAHPDEFSYWEEHALMLGFRAAAAGPLVRSSFRAAQLFPRQSPTPPAPEVC